MYRYYINKIKDKQGANIVHKEGCKKMSSKETMEYLGEFISCEPAIFKAQDKGYNPDGCSNCSFTCNKKAIEFLLGN
jgi:hypothetical protein